MSSALLLAARLRGMSDAALLAALQARALPLTSVRDFFDLADCLLDAGAVQHALSRLNRHTLAVLWLLSERRMSAEQVTERLRELGDTVASAPDSIAAAENLLLVEGKDGRYAAYAPVATQLLSWPARGLPDLATLAALTSRPDPASSPSDRTMTDRLAAERAFSTTSAIAELLFDLRRSPARLLSRGALGLPETKRLAELMAVEPEQVAALIVAAQQAGLVIKSGGRLLPTDAAERWLAENAGTRWLTVAEAWADGLPVDIRRLLADRSAALWGQTLRDWLEWLYPAGGQWLHQRVESRLRETELLGVTAGEILSTAGAQLLARQPDQALETMTAMLPSPVHQLYLQRDLTLVAPGPLDPALDARLRGMAEVEGRTIASRYRMSTASVDRALASGETAASMLGFLQEHSIGGIPQPLRYLVENAAARHGLLRVGEARDDLGGRNGAASYVRSTDTHLLGAVLVDRELAPLGLRASGPQVAVSRMAADQLFWALSDARYPVAAEDAAGAIVPMHRAVTATTATAQQDPLAVLIERLRLGDADTPDDTGQAWLSRQLESAIRAKSSLVVTVTMPSGAVVDYLLEPASIAGGRLRAKDNASGIERTLPLSSIVSVAAPPEPTTD